MADTQNTRNLETEPASGLGQALAAFATAIAMALLFYGVMTPVAVLLRALGRDPLSLRFNAGATSYWVRRDRDGKRPSSMNSQF